MTRIRQPLIAIRNKIRLALVAICLSFLAFTASAAAAEFDVSLHEMQSLLRKSKFDVLEQRFAHLEKAYSEGKISDAIIDRGYTSFAAADPEFETLLAAWVEAKPKSHRPYIARGFYHRKLGWLFRGGRYAYQTSDERIGLMRDNFRIAEKSLVTALKRQPDSGVAFATLINMQMAAGDQDLMNKLFRAGLKADPNSFTVRRSIFNSLLPWWGGYDQDPEIFEVAEPLPNAALPKYPIGIPEAMRRFDQFIKSHQNNSPHLAPLRGLTDYAVALMLSRDGRGQEAMPYYERALTHGGYWFFHDQEGLNFSRMERYNDAVASYTSALEFWPDKPDLLLARAVAHRFLKAYDKANADLDKALSVDPMSPKILREKSANLRAAGDYKAAAAALEDAFFYGELDDSLWDARGRLYLYELKDPKRAIPDLKRTTELDPANSAYWYNYGRALYGVRDCEAVGAYKKYLAVCPQFGNKCKKGNMKFAREVIEYMSHPGHCGN